MIHDILVRRLKHNEQQRLKRQARRAHLRRHPEWIDGSMWDRRRQVIKPAVAIPQQVLHDTNVHAPVLSTPRTGFVRKLLNFFRRPK